MELAERRLEGAVRGLDPLERVGRSDRAAGGGRSGHDRLLLVAECRAARVTLVYPRAVVAEDGKAKEPVRVRQPVAGLLSAGVATGSARHQGCAFGEALEFSNIDVNLKHVSTCL